MKTTLHPIDRWSVYVAAGFLSFCGMMMFSTLPIVVATLQRHYGFHESQLGDIVGCYFAGIVLVSLTTFAWIRRFNWRLIALVGQTISAIAFFLTMSDRGYVQLSILLAAAGVGAGITYALSFTLLGDSDDPDRAFGVNIGFQTGLSTLMFFVLPVTFSNDAGDMRRMLVVMFATVVLTTIGVFWIPGAGQKGRVPLAAATAASPAAACGIMAAVAGHTATFLFMLACTAPWVFIEQAAVARGLDPETIGFTLGAAQFVSLAGSIAAAVIGDRFGKVAPMCIAVAMYVLGIYLLDVFHGRSVFALGTCVFLLPINFLLAFSLGLTAEVDVGGRLIGLSTVSLLGPSLVAPSIAGRLYERYGFPSNLAIGLVAGVVGLACYLGLLHVARRRNLSGVLSEGSRACADGGFRGHGRPEHSRRAGVRHRWNLAGVAMAMTDRESLAPADLHRDPLLRPFSLKHLVLKNRIMSTSHASGLEEGGMPVERYQIYHEEKAKGGLALTMFGGSSNVAPDSPNAFHQLNVGVDAIIPYFQRFSARIHRHDCALMCQITHVGRRGDPYVGPRLSTIGPSAIRETLHRSFPKAMDEHDIARVVRAYGEAAWRCKEGGLDGIETLTVGHMIGQFLSTQMNRRTDRFGGSIQNRCRFGILVHQEIRRRVGDDFIVGIRWVIDEGAAGGLSYEESVTAAKLLEAEAGIDFFNAIFGKVDNHRGLARDNMPGMGSPIAPWVERVGNFKREVTAPVFHAARILDTASARFALRAGHLDMVGMTRPHIADPYIVAKLTAGQEAQIRPCVGATHCMTERRPACLHNPASGYEQQLPQVIAPSRSARRRVVVVGGGPAGLEAARVCAERGHEVVLFEAGGELGGQVLLASRSSWRRDLIGSSRGGSRKSSGWASPCTSTVMWMPTT